MADPSVNPTDIDFEPPEYVLPANRERFYQLCRDIGVFDQESTVFENMVEYVQKHKLDPVIRYSAFTAFLQRKALPGLTIDVNIDTHTKRLIKRLVSHNLCRVLEGTVEEPVLFLLTDRRLDVSELQESRPLDHLEAVKRIIQDVYENIDATDKLDIPFPTVQSVTEAAKTHPELRGVDLSGLWREGVLAIRIDDFSPSFIERSKGQTSIIRIDFDAENHILLTPESERGLFQSVLTKKILQYVQDNPEIQDRIHIVLKKNQKEVPDIHAIFHDIGTDQAFFWILTFKRIMEHLYQHKRNNTTYLHYYEAASLLYQYSLHKREEQQKAEQERRKRRSFKEELLRTMVLDYHEPWTFDRIIAWHNSLPQPPFGDQLSRETVSEILEEANAGPIQAEGIPLVITLATKENLYFVHKYRFAQFFLIQRDREAQRLKNLYVEEWSRNPPSFPSDEAFDLDIRERLSELFHHLLYRAIPTVFGLPNPAQRLFPDIATIKSWRLHDTDLADPQKHKVIYEALVATVFRDKGSPDLKPLHLLLGLDQRQLRKLAREYADRHLPFWRRGLLGLLLGWLFDLLERAAVAEEVRAAVAAARTLEDLDAILASHKDSKALPAVRQIVERRRRELLAELSRLSDKEKEERRKEELESRQRRAEKIAALKAHYLKGRTVEERLASLSKEWNTKLGKAREETENNVVHAVMRVMDRTKRFKLTVEEIETLAERIAADPAFAEIRNKTALKDYIALLIFNRLIRRVEG